MKIVLPSLLVLPSKLATSQYAMWMCEALSRHAQVILYVQKLYETLDKAFEYHGVLPCFEVRETGLMWKPRSFWGARRIARCLTQENPSYVYLFDAPLLRYLRLFASRWNYIYDAEAMPATLVPYVRHINAAKAVICHNQLFKKDLAKIGIESEKILIGQMGVNLEHFAVPASKEALRRQLNLPLTKKIVMYTGHFYEWKGTEILLQAASSLDSDTEVYLVGGKDADIKRICESGKGLSWTNIRMISFQPPALASKYQQAADVLVVPNISSSEDSNYYTSPLKLFQYMAAGRSIVASDLPSIRTILNSENAYLVSPDNPQALAQGIRDALSDHQESARRAERAQEDVKQYTWEKRAERILKFVSEDGANPENGKASEAISY
jgi:glycosyltransferase involved in cell wall biosynthesis